MTAAAYKVLFVCTGNAARGILAEALLNHLGAGRFAAFSGGTRPARMVNPYALEVLQQHGIPTDSLYCKSWEEFWVPQATALDCVIVLARRLPEQAHPVWPGQPVTIHWGMHDPASVRGSAGEKQRAFQQAFYILRARIQYLVNLPVERLDGPTIRRELESVAQLSANIEHEDDDRRITRRK